MLLTLWAILVGLSLVLIVLGLARPSETAQALIGFSLLFLLALSFLNSGLDYKTGYQDTYVYSNATQIDTVTSVDGYTTYTDRTISWWLTIASVLGFAGTLFSLKKTNWGRE